MSRQRRRQSSWVADLSNCGGFHVCYLVTTDCTRKKLQIRDFQRARARVARMSKGYRFSSLYTENTPVIKADVTSTPLR
jgi:hypothetical protein